MISSSVMARCVPSSSGYAPAPQFQLREGLSSSDTATIATFTPASSPSPQKVTDSDRSLSRIFVPSSPGLSSSQVSSVSKPIFKNLGKDEPPVSVDSLLPILVNCINRKTLAHAKHAFSLICNYGLEDHTSIINYVIPMFVSCGSALDAEQALQRSPDRCNEHSWTSLIQGFIEFGDSWHALDLYGDMQDTSVNPSEHTFVALLKACTKQRWIERGWELHMEITKMGYDGNLFLGNTLVGMYAKCGTPLESQRVFDQLPMKDIVSWNALLTGYSEHGWIEETKACIDKMESHGVSADCITYTCGFKACSSSEEGLKMGQTLHAAIIKKGIDIDNLLISVSVIMYARCGALLEGRKVFDELVVDDEVACNALMTGYMEKGFFKEVLRFSTQLLRDGIVSDASVFVSSLKACGTLELPDKGQELHIAIVKRGYDNDAFLGSALVGMYAKSNLLVDAQVVFDLLVVKDLVCWTALISGYAECGHGEEALACYEQMQADLSPCALVFACTLKACCSIPNVSRGRLLHADIVKKGFENESFIGSTLVDLYAKCGSLEEAQQVFDNLAVHDVVTWTALVMGYVDYGFDREALTCLDCMKTENVCPDAIMLVASLKACAGTGFLDRGRDLHVEVAKRGLEKEDVIGVGLVDMYCKCGCFSDADLVFSKLTTQDVVSWNAMIAGFTAHGLVEKASSFFEKMQCAGVSADIISWNSIIMGYAEKGDSKEAYNYFLQMQEQGLLPNDVVFLSVLKACGNMSALQIGKRTHAHVCGFYGGLVSSDSTVSTILIEMYSKCGSMESAYELFKSFTSVHVRMWDVLIRGYARQGEYKVVADLLQVMTADGIPPDDVLFLNVLNVCAHMGLVEMGQQCFHAMTRDYSISPSSKHQTCMVSLLCRAGQLEEAAVLIRQMPSSNLVVWCCLLDACRNWGNVELGRWAFDQAICVRGSDSSPFILMSHIYSDAGMLDAAKSIYEVKLKWVSGRTELHEVAK